MNETLRRALLRARLSEDDVAARLAVDPKTVRRWMEGRVPYLRHRWALAGMLDLDEADLWPQARAVRSRPEEVRAVYPHRDAVPRDVWRALFNSAEHEIDILTDGGLFLAGESDILAVLGGRASSGVKVRICVPDPHAPDSAIGNDKRTPETHFRDAQARYALLGESSNMEIRVHRAILSNSLYRADEQLMVCQIVHGIPGGQAPVLYLRQADSGSDMATTYRESFERIWLLPGPWTGPSTDARGNVISTAASHGSHRPGHQPRAHASEVAGRLLRRPEMARQASVNVLPPSA